MGELRILGLDDGKMVKGISHFLLRAFVRPRI
jgi:hypothetical protein